MATMVVLEAKVSGMSQKKVVYATSVWIQNMYLLPIYFYVFGDILGYENINISMTIILKFQPVPGTHVQCLCSEADF